MYATYIEGKLHYVLFIVTFKSLSALNWEIFPFFCFLWRSFDAAMSKLSFRARALDANKSLPVYHEKDVPDLPDIASVNRVVPQMPTGMEKEEESVSYFNIYFVLIQDFFFAILGREECRSSSNKLCNAPRIIYFYCLRHHLSRSRP